MKKTVIGALLFSCFLSFTTAMLFAIDKGPLKYQFNLSEAPNIGFFSDLSKEKIVFFDNEKEFNIYFNLLDKVFPQLLTGESRKIIEFNLLRTRKKYDNLDTYIFTFEFSLQSCEDFNNRCQEQKGTAEVEVFLGRTLFNEDLKLYSMPSIEVVHIL